MKKTLICASMSLLSLAVNAAELTKEKQLVDGKSIPVSNKQEISFAGKGVRDGDNSVDKRELFYAKKTNQGWSEFESLPEAFGPDTPINWKPAEGHYRVYVKITEGRGGHARSKNTPTSEFIIDRTAPTMKLLQPSSGIILSTEKAFTIKWNVNDLHLHSTPVSLYWSDDNTTEKTLIAEGLPNSGSYAWTTPSDMFRGGKLILEATDKVLNTASVTNDNIIIDGAPPQSSITGPTTSMSRNVDVAINAHDVGPASKVTAVQLWYSADAGTNWTSGPKITKEPFEKISWLAPNDGNYALALVATDIANNSNSVPVSPEDIDYISLVDTVEPSITLLSAIGIEALDDSDDGSSRRIFRNGEKVKIAFTVEDMIISSAPVSVYFQSDPKAPWEPIATAVKTDSVEYTLPNIASSTCRIKVEAVDMAGNVGVTISPEAFTIDNEVEAGPLTPEL